MNLAKHINKDDVRLFIDAWIRNMRQQIHPEEAPIATTLNLTHGYELGAYINMYAMVGVYIVHDNRFLLKQDYPFELLGIESQYFANHHTRSRTDMICTYEFFMNDFREYMTLIYHYNKDLFILDGC